MTDIQRHLKGIRKIARRVIADATSEGDINLVTLRDELRAFLPFSYGIGMGVIRGETGTSQPISLLLYDVPLAGGAYATPSTLDTESLEYDINHVLLVLDIAVTYTLDTLRDALERIASVKQLVVRSNNTPRYYRSHRPIVPRGRLPYALLCCDTIATPNKLVALYTLMQDYDTAVQPDQIESFAQSARFRNPLLDGDGHYTRTMGWYRVPETQTRSYCYMCKMRLTRQHLWYDQLCSRCGDLNHRKRIDTANLEGYYALITGARIKIGYATALRLLRAGATVIATSRFPVDAARRYAQESDFAEWQARLHIYGFDLRQIPRLEAFIKHLDETYPHLDIIINNAAQTIKRPQSFYNPLLAAELNPPAALQNHIYRLPNEEHDSFEHLRLTFSEPLLEIADTSSLAPAQDEHGQPFDERDFNSWVMRLEEVPPLEMMEVQLVNSVAPALLVGQLKPMLMRSPHKARFIVNVSAAEGRFAQNKNGYHPHTNMAKAALNMLTRTIAESYEAERIYVNSVDPGWVSDQAPRIDANERAAGNAHVPLDLIDAAARVCEPIFSMVKEKAYPYAGRLRKDYSSVSW